MIEAESTLLRTNKLLVTFKPTGKPAGQRGTHITSFYLSTNQSRYKGLGALFGVQITSI
jgi:hypothetical protein